MITIRDIVEEFIELSKNISRLEALKSILDKNKITYNVVHTVISKPGKFGNAVGESRNVVVSLRHPTKVNRKKHITIGAHYDVFPGSSGINDNTCAVAALIKFILSVDLNRIRRNIEVVFFDKEETGMVGSRHYSLQKWETTLYAIILDVIGFGDALYYSGDKRYLHKTRKLQQTLPSDNYGLSPYISNSLIVAIPDRDIIHDSTSCSYRMNNRADNTFYKSFHNRELDNDISIINWELIDNLVEMLITHSYTGGYEPYRGGYKHEK